MICLWKKHIKWALPSREARGAHDPKAFYKLWYSIHVSMHLWIHHSRFDAKTCELVSWYMKSFTKKKQNTTIFSTTRAMVQQSELILHRKSMERHFKVQLSTKWCWRDKGGMWFCTWNTETWQKWYKNEANQPVFHAYGPSHLTTRHRNVRKARNIHPNERYCTWNHAGGAVRPAALAFPTKLPYSKKIAISQNNSHLHCLQKPVTTLFAFLPLVPITPPAAAAPFRWLQRLVHQKQQNRRMHILQKQHKMGTDLQPHLLQVPQTLKKRQIQQINPAATHLSPNPPRYHPPSTWCASAHRNGLLFLWAAGSRSRYGILSKSS